MASLSSPLRVLQQKKTSLEAEHENFVKLQLHQLSVSIGKAVNPSETPVKEKHVRSAIIGTYQEKSGSIFWTFALRQPLQENQIVAWKFCHVLHKILREGHQRVIPDSQQYRGKLEDIGKLWQHLREGYGRLIRFYIHLLITKLDFHKRNPRIPGNLQVTSEELESIGENDINFYFQMSVEMFDYMDDILNLQHAVFGSLDMSRSNSMTACGQCRLAPLIPCIQDASQLYDLCVKILFKLHGALPADTLGGHRDRFSKQFHDLKTFYTTIKHMQYFKHLITIPSLPANPPNFLIQSELRTYVTPVVVLPPEDPIDQCTVDSLIDTSDTNSLSGDQSEITRNGSISPDVLAERDSLIDHLHHENSRQRQELHRLSSEHLRVVGELRNRVFEVEASLSAKGKEIDESRELNQELTKCNADVVTRFCGLEEKNKVLEEKFQKLKDAYTKLREEHISLIRKKAEGDKQLGGIKIIQQQLERRTLTAEQRLQELVQGQATTEQEAQRVAEARADLDEVRQQFDASKTENLALVAKIDFITSEKAAVEADLHDLLAQKEELDHRIANLETEKELYHRQAKIDTDVLVYDLLSNCIAEAEFFIQNTMYVIDDPAVTAVTCTPEYLATLINQTIKSLDELIIAYNEYKDDSKKTKQMIHPTINAGYLLAVYLMHVKFTSNTSADITLSDRLSDECKELGSQSLTMLSCIKEKSSLTEEEIIKVKNQIQKISLITVGLSNGKGEIGPIEDLVENELLGMDKAIEEAAAKIQDMLEKSRAGDSGLKLEVNGKILDSCTDLMKGIKKLVTKSRILQKEIVDRGKGTASATEFYKRNYQWSEGLISAAKATGKGANFLLQVADKVVSGNGKFEELVVASQSIAASTAQLVVASRVKADRNSKNLAELLKASREVTAATGGVVATSKSCSHLVEENEDLDVTGLSLHQAKTLEMEAQIHILELEQTLESERLRLAALRRRHYQLDNENDG